MSYCSVISFCMFLCALEGEYSFALLFEMHYLVIIHLLAQDKDMVRHECSEVLSITSTK